MPVPSGGIPRRDPCAKCGLPVFIAERLNVGKQLYHRTCFRCARCNSQLTLSNYYETETEKQYCCETCPDEEKVTESHTDGTVEKSLLLRSLSDEEKTAGLLCVEDNDDYSKMFETALENNPSLDKYDTLSSVRSSDFTRARSQFINSQVEDSDDADTLPDLPMTKPPEFKIHDVTGHSDGMIVNIDSSNLNIKSESMDSGLPLNTQSMDSVICNNSISDKNQLTSTASLELEDKNIVTKEISQARPDASVVSVKARMRLFENDTQETKTFSPKRSSLTPVDFKLESKTHIFSKSQTVENEDKPRSASINSEVLLETNVNVDIEASSTNNDIDLSNNDVQETNPNCEDKKPNEIIEIDDSYAEVEEISSVDTSSILEVSEDCKPLEIEKTCNESPQDDTNPFDENDDEPLQDQIGPEEITMATKEKEVYPDDLNPFDDVEADEKNAEVPVPARRKKLTNIPRFSLNPFGYDADDEKVPGIREERHLRLVGATRISLNPFWKEIDVAVTEELTSTIIADDLKDKLTTPEPKKRSVSSKSSTPFGSNNSINSGTLSIRNKKPAPKPPVTSLFVDKREGYRTPQHSPRLTPKYRKNKKAPPPPFITSTPGVSRNKDMSIATADNTTVDATNIFLESTTAEEEKVNKDEINKNRRSLINNSDSDKNLIYGSTPDKSTYGQWKRKKGPAPSRPIAQKRSIKSFPIVEIKRELGIIELQQQGLEKQGVRLEQIIRDKCEGPNSDIDGVVSIEVEDLILQLFEVVNEKNEICRKQAELMYLQRQQRLEEEHADIEYQIRCLIMQPEANKTDSDKTREDELIERLVKVVERRNEIIECLEMDRIREAEEDDSINTHLNKFTSKRDENTNAEESSLKKATKKQKKEKKFKLKSSPKIDIDKDIDEYESSKTDAPEKVKLKKKKKFNLF